MSPAEHTMPPPSPSLTHAFVRLLRDLSLRPLPHDVERQAKRCLLDYLGATIAGAWQLGSRIESLLDFSGPVSTGVRVIGVSHQASVETAALCNGIAAHALEMDDGSRFGMIHPGAAVVSAVLPVAQRFGVDGRQLLVGITIGYECAIRVASAVAPSHYRRGFHPTATCGGIGAAAGVAAMLGFPDDMFETAVTAAAIAAGGSLKVVDAGSELKPLNAGRAAATGLISAMAARAGFTHPPDALEGPAGFLDMMCDHVEPERLVHLEPDVYRISQVYVKPYAACRHAHPAIDACLRYRNQIGRDIDRLRSVTIRTYGGLAGRHDHRAAGDPAAARMSIPVSCAIALHRGSAGVGDYTDEVLGTPEVKALAERITVVKDDLLDTMLPQRRVAVLTFERHGGAADDIRVDFAKGEPENPVTDDELEDKFSELLRWADRTTRETVALIEAVKALPKGADGLFALL